jgi:Rps23 Pro-64 3,4-dihydroxylase Tpa1-like proline 4-hydroxylase
MDLLMNNHQELEFLNYDKLKSLAIENAEGYKSATPYPHIVLEEFLNPEVLDLVLAEFELADNEWREFDTKYEKKLQLNNEELMGPVTRSLIHYLNSAPFLHFLSKLSGIEGLIPDPYLSGGGLHKIPRGGRLGIHVDFNFHKQMNAFRRLNVLIYLNKDWKEEFGGHFEMWSDKKGTEKQRVLPLFNRMAMFTTTSNSYHGHPSRLTCPEDRARRSLALYYYTAGESGDQKKNEHSTVFLNEKGQEEELGKITFFGRVKRKLKKVIKPKN